MSGSTLKKGDTFLDRYVVIRRIKSGGMGCVYEVLDQHTKASRALKLLVSRSVEETEFLRRFEQEAQITGQIESDHVVRTFDWGIDKATRTPFIVMELLRGEDLGTIIRKYGALSADKVFRHVAQTGRGLEKMHGRNVIHRDLKPDNLLVTMRDDGTTCLKILDFGVAKDVATSGNESSMAIGTPLYMAPEQAGVGDIGPHTDRFALAHVAYTLLVGEAYWQAEFASEGMDMIAHLFSALPEAASARANRRKQVTLPAGFDAWFEKATARSIIDRFPSMILQTDALADALAVGSGAEKVPADTLEAAMISRRSAAQLSSFPSSPSILVAAPEPPARARRPWVPYVFGSLGLAGVAAIILIATRTSSAPAAVAQGTSPPFGSASGKAAPVPTTFVSVSSPSAPIPSSEPSTSPVASVSAAPLPPGGTTGGRPGGPFTRPTATSPAKTDNPWDFKPPK